MSWSSPLVRREDSKSAILGSTSPDFPSGAKGAGGDKQPALSILGLAPGDAFGVRADQRVSSTS